MSEKKGWIQKTMEARPDVKKGHEILMTGVREATQSLNEWANRYGMQGDEIITYVTLKTMLPVVERAMDPLERAMAEDLLKNITVISNV